MRHGRKKKMVDRLEWDESILIGGFKHGEIVTATPMDDILQSHAVYKKYNQSIQVLDWETIGVISSEHRLIRKAYKFSWQKFVYQNKFWPWRKK